MPEVKLARRQMQKAANGPVYTANAFSLNLLTDQKTIVLMLSSAVLFFAHGRVSSQTKTKNQANSDMAQENN